MRRLDIGYSVVNAQPAVVLVHSRDESGTIRFSIGIHFFSGCLSLSLVVVVVVHDGKMRGGLAAHLKRRRRGGKKTLVKDRELNGNGKSCWCRWVKMEEGNESIIFRLDFESRFRDLERARRRRVGLVPYAVQQWLQPSPFSVLPFQLASTRMLKKKARRPPKTTMMLHILSTPSLVDH